MPDAAAHGEAGGERGGADQQEHGDGAAAVEWASSTQHSPEPLGDRVLQNPVPRPPQVFGIGTNYRDHIDEAGGEPPKRLLVFTKFPSCVTGPFDPIEVRVPTVDWEVELVVVMAKRAERVAEADAWDHVAGFTVGQDISDRKLQLAGKHAQFSLGKSRPTYGPIGPCVVSLDELDDPNDLELGCSLDGEVMQRSRTSELIFGVAQIVAMLSATCTLLPGDLIFTGTPSGVGIFRTPPQYLQPGQELRSWIEGIGEIVNPTVGPVE